MNVNYFTIYWRHGQRHHDPEYPDRAVKAFLKRYNDGPFNPSGCISANIQELCEKQGFVKK